MNQVLDKKFEYITKIIASEDIFKDLIIRYWRYEIDKSYIVYIDVDTGPLQYGINIVLTSEDIYSLDKIYTKIKDKILSLMIEKAI